MSLFESWIRFKFGFIRSLGLFEVWFYSKFGFARSLGLFDVLVCSNPLILGSSYL